MDENEISKTIIGAAIEVHRHMGPGLLESVYQKCLVRELQLRDMNCKAEEPIIAKYKGITFDVAYRIDILVEKKVAIELKVAEKILPVHEAQLLSYIKLKDIRLGLLINFNSPVLKAGIKRIVNGL